MTDPEKILDVLLDRGASLLPLGGVGEDTGGYKGYGYATVVEILSSALQQGYFLESHKRREPRSFLHSNRCGGFHRA